jgi:hypothetical protein
VGNRSATRRRDRTGRGLVLADVCRNGSRVHREPRLDLRQSQPPCHDRAMPDERVRQCTYNGRLG